MWRKRRPQPPELRSCISVNGSVGTIIITTGIGGAVMVRTTGALGTEIASVLAIFFLHRLHEMRTVFGGH